MVCNTSGSVGKSVNSTQYRCVKLTGVESERTRKLFSLWNITARQRNNWQTGSKHRCTKSAINTGDTHLTNETQGVVLEVVPGECQPDFEKLDCLSIINQKVPAWRNSIFYIFLHPQLKGQAPHCFSI